MSFERQTRGLNPLKWDDHLWMCARLECRRLAEHLFVDHTDPYRRNIFAILKLMYPELSFYGISSGGTRFKNLITTPLLVASFFVNYMSSETIQESDITHVGVAFYPIPEVPNSIGCFVLFGRIFLLRQPLPPTLETNKLLS